MSSYLPERLLYKSIWIPGLTVNTTSLEILKLIKAYRAWALNLWEWDLRIMTGRVLSVCHAMRVVISHQVEFVIFHSQSPSLIFWIVEVQLLSGLFLSSGAECLRMTWAQLDRIPFHYIVDSSDDMLSVDGVKWVMCVWFVLVLACIYWVVSACIYETI